MSKKNILITCAGGSSSVYQARKLKNKFNVFLADANEMSIAPYLGFPFAKIPFGSSREFISVLNKLINKWRIDSIIPGADEELLKVAQYCEKNKKISAVIPEKEFIELCLNKKNLMKELALLKISKLTPYLKIKDVKYPALVKPNFGRGSRGVHAVENCRQLNGYLGLYNKKFSELLVQQYIGGDEYTVSVIVNNFNELIGIVPKKIILKKGITKLAVTEHNQSIDKICKKIISKLNPRGPFNIQLKIWKEKIYIFEINPRLSTTSVLTDVALGNEIEFYIKYYNKNINRPLMKFKEGLYLIRHEENYFKLGKKLHNL